MSGKCVVPLIQTFFLAVHVQVTLPPSFLCGCITMRPSHPTGPPFSSSYMNSSTAPVWSVLQRLKLCSRGQSKEGLGLPRLSGHARHVSLNIIKHCDTQHNQTLFWGYATKTNPAFATPGAEQSVGGAEEADVGKAKSSWCLCWTAKEWETHGTRSPCFP